MHRESIEGWLKHVDFMLIDLVTMQQCFIAVYILLHTDSNPYIYGSFRLLAILILVAQLIVSTMTTPYKNILKRGMFIEMTAIIKYVIYVFILVISFLFAVQKSVIVSRLQFALTLLMFTVVAQLTHYLNKAHVNSQKSERRSTLSIMLVTSQALLKEGIEKLHPRYNTGNYIITGIVLLDRKKPSIQDYKGIPVLGYNGEVIRAILHEWVDEVFFLQPDDMTYPTELMEAIIAMGIQVHYTISVLNSDKLNVTSVQKLGQYRVLTSSRKTISLRDATVKRALDILGGLVGCFLTVLIAIVIGPIIKFKDPGPIFFTQDRIGKNGKVFKMYKFRSMYMDAEERKAALMAQNKIQDGMMFKMEDDPRIIGSEKKDKNGKPKGIGNFIRNTSLDEFPQFFNVLKGDMSLVGTRPPTLDEWEKYGLQHRIRMATKPGITGMWQVSGRSDIVDFDEVVRLDKEYIDEWSPLLDIKLLMKTVVVVLKGSGAA